MPLANLMGNNPCLLRKSSQGFSCMPSVSVFCQNVTSLEQSLSGLSPQSSEGWPTGLVWLQAVILRGQ